MRTTTAFSALCVLVTVALANPVTVKLDKRDSGIFRLLVDHWHQNQCPPEGCGVANFDSYQVTVDDCKANGCDARPAANLAWDGSYCNQDISVCGRTFKLVSRGDNDCKKTTDVTSANNGQGYATLVEGDKDIGTCSVDFTSHYSRVCGLGGGHEFESRVYCAYS